MIEVLELKKENMKRINKNVKTRMAVHTHTHTLYCHLENKKTLICRYLKLNNKIKDRTILKIEKDVRASP